MYHSTKVLIQRNAKEGFNFQVSLHCSTHTDSKLLLPQLHSQTVHLLQVLLSCICSTFMWRLSAAYSSQTACTWNNSTIDKTWWASQKLMTEHSFLSCTSWWHCENQLPRMDLLSIYSIWTSRCWHQWCEMVLWLPDHNVLYEGNKMPLLGSGVVGSQEKWMPLERPHLGFIFALVFNANRQNYWQHVLGVRI